MQKHHAARFAYALACSSTGKPAINSIPSETRRKNEH